MAVSATPTGMVRFFVYDPATGLPLVGAKIHTLVAGTTDPADTWSDAEKNGLNPNPVVTAADGGAAIYIDGNYKFVVNRSDDTLLYEIDNILGGVTAFDRPASGITMLPFDDIAATDVQAGLEEIAQKRVKDTDIIDIAHGGTAGTTPAEARDNLGLEISVDIMAYDDDLQQLANQGNIAFVGLLWGLTIANNASDATNDIDIAAGMAIDNDTFGFMRLSSGLTKRLDANWAVGNNQGGLDTGSIANDWYYVFLIKRPDTGVVDVLFSASPTSPTMPTNYTLKRRIGAFLRESGAIRAFRQLGDMFTWSTAAGLYNGVVLNTAQTLAAMVPPDITVEACINVGWIAIEPGTETGFTLLTGPWQTDIAPSAAAFTVVIRMDLDEDNADTSGYAQIVTDNGNIRWRSSSTQGSLAMTCVGWFDRRGRLLS